VLPMLQSNHISTHGCCRKWRFSLAFPSGEGGPLAVDEEKLSLKQFSTFSVGERLGAPDVAIKSHLHSRLRTYKRPPTNCRGRRLDDPRSQTNHIGTPGCCRKWRFSLAFPSGEGGPLAVDEEKLSLKQISTFSVGERLGAPDVTIKSHLHSRLLLKASVSFGEKYLKKSLKFFHFSIAKPETLWYY